MTHTQLFYALPDHKFARQLAVQLEQRGVVVWPVPEIPPTEEQLALSRAEGLPDASHILGILSINATPDVEADCQRALEQKKRAFAIVIDEAPVPSHLKNCPVVRFQGRFLMAFEELTDHLRKTRAAIRPLTVEHPPPVAKADLLPIMFPNERCLREDRLRINYNLPMILAQAELDTRLPAFLVAFQFELGESTKKRLVARRLNQKFPLFDPRRADHELAVERRKGHLKVYYQMTRMQVYHWFPAHYRTLDREAAALYRYLATGDIQGIVEPVNIQARRARVLSVAALVIIALCLAFIVLLIAL